MKALLILIITLIAVPAIHAQVGFDDGYVELQPTTLLQDNDCVFRNKGYGQFDQRMYPLLVFACDRIYSPKLAIPADHLPNGTCVYNIVKKMSGETIGRSVRQCPIVENNQDIKGILPDADLENFIPPGPNEAGEKSPTKPQIKQKKTSIKKSDKNQKSEKEQDNEENTEIKNYIPPAIDQDF